MDCALAQAVTRMNINILRLIITGFIVATLGACSMQQGYYSLRAAQREQCGRIADSHRRDRCYQDANTSYNKYEHERKESSGQTDHSQ